MNNTALVDKAINYAVLHHKNVFRKGKNVPYILHPLEAMSIVASITDDHELMASAALHDLIEDTDVTYDDIKLEFGKRIADIVAAESINLLPNYDKLSWVEAKQLAIDKLKEAPIDVKIIALSDKLSNMRAINNDYRLNGEEFWNRFKIKDKNIHKWRYNALLECFEELKDTRAYKEFKHLVFETFNGE